MALEDTNKQPELKPYTGADLEGKSASVPQIKVEFPFEGTTFKGITVTPVKNDKGEQLKEPIDPYYPDDTLVEAVALMRILRRPLLLRGEPGCGKTRAAQAVAYELYGNDYRQHYFEWHVKSTSKAQDGLYTFDHIARLREAHTRRSDETAPETNEDRAKFRFMGPMGKAFLASKPGRPAILLIDEIDKADLDFPNDLLLELDEMRFTVPETKEEFQCEERPLIFITSNQERELPQAFLRRCLFHYIKFPDRDRLNEIMLANFPSFKEAGMSGTEFVNKAIDKFEQLRKDLGANPTANKNVSTSELKDWIKILEHHFKSGAINLEKFEKSEKLPFYTSLLKTENDLKSMNLFVK